MHFSNLPLFVGTGYCITGDIRKMFESCNFRNFPVSLTRFPLDLCSSGLGCEAEALAACPLLLCLELLGSEPLAALTLA